MGRSDKKTAVLVSITRGIALFFGVFTLLNLLGGLYRDGFDANEWWISLSSLPQLAARSVLGTFSLLALAYALRPRAGKVRQWVSGILFGSMTAAALYNGFNFYALLAARGISSNFAVPLSFVIAALLLLLTFAAARGEPDGLIALDPKRRSIRRTAAVVASACGCCVLFALLQMLCFGKTDYRRHADAAVVFGARVYANGRPSDALTERTQTACKLYQHGYVRRLIFSGGPGDGAVHETEAMQKYAIGRGVRPEDIILDPAGLNTQATVENTTTLFQQNRIRRVLAVSHFYHLPRVKLAYQRLGWSVYTVPAESDYTLARLPIFMAREVVALGKYYFDPLLHRMELASSGGK